MKLKHSGDAPPTASPKQESESRHEFFSRAVDASSRRVDHLAHGYEWRFADRVLRIQHELGERSVRDLELDEALDRNINSGQS